MNGPKTTFTAAPEFAFNPMAGNPFAARADAVRALKGLSAPLMGYFSEGKGRLRLGSAGAHFHEAAADLEGLARPLWDLAPLVIVEADLDYLETLAMDDGWYRDGPGRRAEHYIPFAMHFYGLIYAASSERHGPDDAERAERFRQRAPDFAPQIRDWYADDGAALPYGRSLTYRFAHAAFGARSRWRMSRHSPGARSAATGRGTSATGPACRSPTGTGCCRWATAIRTCW